MSTGSPIALWLLLIAAGAATIYYAAVTSGLYKDPLLGQFRRYGDEMRVYPLCRFLYAFGAMALSLALLVSAMWSSQSYLRRMFPPVFFVTLMLIAWGSSIIIYRRPEWREALPRWYFFLLRYANRQERRQLGYAWLRIPRKMRLRLNGDQKAFSVWVELMRLTVIYGAFDPNSPWHVWE
jgi:hypothetical protein